MVQTAYQTKALFGKICAVQSKRKRTTLPLFALTVLLLVIPPLLMPFLCPPTQETPAFPRDSQHTKLSVKTWFQRDTPIQLAIVGDPQLPYAKTLYDFLFSIYSVARGECDPVQRFDSLNNAFASDCQFNAIVQLSGDSYSIYTNHEMPSFTQNLKPLDFCETEEQMDECLAHHKWYFDEKNPLLHLQYILQLAYIRGFPEQSHVNGFVERFKRMHEFTEIDMENLTEMLLAPDILISSLGGRDIVVAPFDSHNNAEFSLGLVVTLILFLLFWSTYAAGQAYDLSDEYVKGLRQNLNMIGAGGIAYPLSYFMYSCMVALTWAVVGTGISLGANAGLHWYNYHEIESVTAWVWMGVVYGMLVMMSYLFSALWGMACFLFFPTDHLFKCVVLSWFLNLAPVLQFLIPRVDWIWRNPLLSVLWGVVPGNNLVNLFYTYFLIYVNPKDHSMSILITCFASIFCWFSMAVSYLYFEQVYHLTTGEKKRGFFFFLHSDFWREIGVLSYKDSESADFERRVSVFSDSDSDKDSAFEDDGEDDDRKKQKKIARDFRNRQCITYRDVSVKYPNGHFGLQSVDLTMYVNEVFVLIGATGSGKSTILNTLSGSVPTTTGRLQVCGYDLPYARDVVRQTLGVCSKQEFMWSEMTVLEHFEFFHRIRAKKINQRRLRELAAQVGLEDSMDKQISQLSAGQRSLLSVACAFVGDSKVVVLHDPCSTIDPHSRKLVANFIRSKKCNRIIVMSTNQMDEADKLGDRIAFMEEGMVQATGTPWYLRARFDVGFIVQLQVKKDPESVLEALKAHFHHMLGEPVDGTHLGRELRLNIPEQHAEKMSDVINKLTKLSGEHGIESFKIHKTDLNEVFMSIESHNIREKVELPNPPQLQDVTPDFTHQTKALIKRRYLMTRRDLLSMLLGVAIPVFLVFLACVFQSYMADTKVNPSRIELCEKVQLFGNALHAEQFMEDYDKEEGTFLHKPGFQIEYDEAADYEQRNFGNTVILKDDYPLEESTMWAKVYSHAMLMTKRSAKVIPKDFVDPYKPSQSELIQYNNRQVAMIDPKYKNFMWFNSDPQHLKRPSLNIYANANNYHSPTRMLNAALVKYKGNVAKKFTTVDPYVLNKHYDFHYPDEPKFRQMLESYFGKSMAGWLLVLEAPSLFPAETEWRRTVDDPVNRWKPDVDYMNQYTKIELLGMDSEISSAQGRAAVFHRRKNFLLSYIKFVGDLPSRNDQDIWEMAIFHMPSGKKKQEEGTRANIVFSVLIAMAYVCVLISIVSFIMWDKESGIKEHLFGSGCMWRSYLLSNLICDSVLIALPMLCSIFCFLFLGHGGSVVNRVSNGLFDSRTTIMEQAPMFFLSLFSIPAMCTFIHFLTYLFRRTRTATMGVFLLCGYVSIILLVIVIQIRFELLAVEVSSFTDPGATESIGLLNSIYRFITMTSVNPVFVFLDGSLMIVAQPFFEIASLQWFGDLRGAFKTLFKTPEIQMEMMKKFMSQSMQLELIHDLMPSKFGLGRSDSWVCQRLISLMETDMMKMDIEAGPNGKDYYYDPKDSAVNVWKEWITQFCDSSDAHSDAWVFAQGGSRYTLGLSLFYLILGGLIYFAFVVGCEYLARRKLDYKGFWSVWITYLYGPKPARAPVEPTEETVILESQRVENLKEARSEVAVWCQNLEHVYPDGTQGVEGVSFASKEGTILGLVGTNGSGKTTTCEMITYRIPHDSGDVCIYGNDPRTAQHDVGYMPSSDMLYGPLTVDETLDLYMSLRGITSGQDVETQKQYLYGVFNLPNEKRVDTLSVGQYRMLMMAVALIGNPKVLVADEPTRNLDPVTQNRVHKTLLKIAKGRTIVMSTNSLSEADKLCSCVLMMHKGQLCSAGTTNEVKTSYVKSTREYYNVVELQLEFVLPENTHVHNELMLVGVDDINDLLTSHQRRNLLRGTTKKTWRGMPSESEPAGAFAMYAITDRRIIAFEEQLTLFLSKTPHMVEVNGSYAKWILKANPADIFDFVNAHAEDLHIASFSIGTVGLEQLFSLKACENSEESREFRVAQAIRAERVVRPSRLTVVVEEPQDYEPSTGSVPVHAPASPRDPESVAEDDQPQASASPGGLFSDSD